MTGPRPKSTGRVYVVPVSGGKVKLMSEDAVLESAYLLGRRDQLREDREVLRANDVEPLLGAEPKEPAP